MGSELQSETTWCHCFRCVILSVLWRMDWSDKEVAVGELLEGCFSDSVEIMVVFSWVTVGD